MTWIIARVRMWFCRHEWEALGDAEIYESWGGDLPSRRVRTYRCRKCGYVQRVKF